MSEETVWLGSAASLLAGLATGVRALPVLFTRKFTTKELAYYNGKNGKTTHIHC